MGYFDYCQSLTSDQASYVCWYNYSLVPLTIIVAIIVMIYKFIVKKLKPFALIRRVFSKSLFYSLREEHPYLSFFLFIIVAYGGFFIRPVAYVMFEQVIGGTKDQQIYMSIVKDSITTAIDLFSVIFVLNFYGVKSEFIRSQGDPTIPRSARALFINMITRRSIVVTLIYFGGSMINFLLDPSNFKSISSVTDSMYDWALKTIYYGFLLVFCVNRLYYVFQVHKIIEIQAKKRRELQTRIYIDKHIEEQVLTVEGLIKNVRYQRPCLQEEFLLRIDAEINDICQKSSDMFQQNFEAVDQAGSEYIGLVKNHREQHLLGSVWLIFTLIDSAFNFIVSIIMVIYENIANQENAIGLTMVIFVFYVLETTFQSFLTLWIVTSRQNFGPEQEAGLSVDFGRRYRVVEEVRSRTDSAADSLGGETTSQGV